jgi:hypothetical protein
MNLHYKIVEVWPNDHLIVVRYWTDVISEEFLSHPGEKKEDGSPMRCRSDVSITVPIPAPTGQELEELILNQAPLEWLRTLEKVSDPKVDTSMSEILSMANKTFIRDEKEVTRIRSGMTLTDAEIEDLINRVSQQHNTEK